MAQSIAEIKEKLKAADEEQFAALKAELAGDERKGVIAALTSAEKRLSKARALAAETHEKYLFQEQFGEPSVTLGIDEVGRGPLAGPLCVAGVVLPAEPEIVGLNDSKQLSEDRREELAEQIKQVALASAVVMIEPADIDECGMAQAIDRAFAAVIAQIDAQLPVEVVLIDGVPQHLDPREHAVVKGDSKAACIAAASILAKVTRDNLMKEYDALYPAYGFASNKGYGSASHIEAIKTQGLTPIHRKSFCSNFTQVQQRLF